MNNLFSSIESFRGDPTSSLYKNDVESQSKILVSSIQSIYDDIEELEEDNYSLLTDQVDEVNSLLEEITYINEKIQQNGETNDLLDKRDALEDQLSVFADIDVSTENNNYILQMAGENVIFNNTNMHEISIQEEYIKQKDIYTTSDLDDGNISDGDSVTITLNNTTSITLSASVSGLPENELKQQIVDAINTSSEFNDVEAYLDTSNNLIIQSLEGGEDNTFDIKIDIEGSTAQKDESISIEGSDNISVAMYNSELNLTGGTMKSLTEGLNN